MTTRRELLAGALALAALSACGQAETPRARAAPRQPGRLFARTGAGLVAVDLATAGVIATYPDAVPDATWKTLRHLTPEGELRVLDAATGTLRDSAQVTGGQIKAVSTSGRLVAVGPRPGPRTSTTITLLEGDGDGRRVRTLRLDGNVEPEAFSTDDQVMYVLEYLPPDRPERYRVRMHDLAAGRSTPLLTRDKQQVPAGKEEEMRGQGRQAVLDSSRNVLYTLYTHQPDHQHVRDLVAGHDSAPEVHAFVHVLNLDQRWAYCLDLPQPFGQGPAPAHTLALSPMGDRLYVFDATSGRLVAASTEQLAIERGAFLPAAAAPAGAQALATGDLIYLASGSQVQVVDPAVLSPVGTWPLPAPARGLARLRGELLVGAGEQVVRLDLATGSSHGVIDLPGLQAVVHAS